MLNVLFREAAILIGCLMVPPSILGLLFLHAGKLDSAVRAAAEAVHGAKAGLHGITDFYVLWVLPYLVVQGVRGHLWAGRSPAGRQVTYSLYALGLTVIVWKALAGALDLFYLMWALDDLPGELLQFIELETTNLSVAAAAALLAALCLRIAWAVPNGTKNGRQLSTERSKVQDDSLQGNERLKAGTP